MKINCWMFEERVRRIHKIAGVALSAFFDEKYQVFAFISFDEDRKALPPFICLFQKAGCSMHKLHIYVVIYLAAAIVH